MITRRTFLASLGAIAGAAACRSSANAAVQAASSQRRRLDRIGIELYTVRRQLRADMAGTLAQLAAIGYKEVEFAGYFGRPAADIRALLTQNGLTSPSTHVGYDELVANWDRATDYAFTLGHQYLIIPSPPNNTRTIADWRRVADQFNRTAERAKARGLGFGYHNHGSELKPLEGQVPLQLLLANTDPKLVSFQLDVFWAASGGGDPRALIKEHPNRFVMLHIKDSSGPPAHRQVDIGAGTIDFAAILRQDLSQQHLVKHVYVEHDEPADPMLFAKSAFDYLSTLEF